MSSYPDQRPVVLHHGCHMQTSGRILGTWQGELYSKRREFTVKLLQLALEEKAPALWAGKRVL